MIRPVLADDFPAIAEMTNHYITHTAIHFGLEPVSPNDLRASWQKNAHRHPYLVSIDDSGVVVAYAKAGTWRERAAYDQTAETGIYVRHDRCGQGLGQPIYRALIDACRAAGLHTLVAGVALPNPASVRLHEACGFASVGVFRQVGRKMGQWHDVGWYQLML